jgi:hypothetical protein
MDKETKREVEFVVRREWYRKSQTFGEGGWGHFYLLADNWKTYVLEAFGKHDASVDESYWDEIEKITAKDDETAVQAFKSLYHLDMFEMWDIKEKIVEYRLVDTSDKGE